MTRVGDAVPFQGEGRKSRAYIYIGGRGPFRCHSVSSHKAGKLGLHWMKLDLPKKSTNRKAPGRGAYGLALDRSVYVNSGLISPQVC